MGTRSGARSDEIRDGLHTIVVRATTRIPGRPPRTPSKGYATATQTRRGLPRDHPLWPHNGRNLAAFTKISSELLRCRFPAQDTNNPLISISE